MKGVATIASALVYFWSTFAIAISSLNQIEDLYLEDWVMIVGIAMPILNFLVTWVYKRRYWKYISRRKYRDEKLEDVRDELENEE